MTDKEINAKVVDFLLEGGRGVANSVLFKNFTKMQEMPQSEWGSFIVAETTKEAFDLARDNLI